MKEQEFTILPILGRKTSVPQNDPSLFSVIGERIAMTHDVGGVNFDLARTRQAVTKSSGYTVWTASANAQATKCMGLFMLYDGTNRNHLFFDNGKVYYISSALAQVEIAAAAPVVFANTDADLYSVIQVGTYAVWADFGEHTPYKWKHGDANSTKLAASGTEYVFRYLTVFQRRVIGAYTTETDGDIIVRWSTDWPTTAIGSLNFPAASSLYVPNDDSITGIATMGMDRCYVYCDNSISQLIYYPDYTAPFRIYTVCPKQGFSNHHSIVNVGDRHFGFNRNYGFCEYRGGESFPFNGKPISENIETDIRDIDSDSYGIIVGCYVPFTREVVWTVPMGGKTTNTHLMYYNIDTGQWRIEDRVMRYVDVWRMYGSYTWSNFISELGQTMATWLVAGNHTWAYYTSMHDRLVYANTDGHLYYHTGENLNAANINGYRIEPIMDFGDPKRKDAIQEIWFDIGEKGSFSIDCYHRAGNTVGEVTAATWVSIGSISCNSPESPSIRNIQKTGRLHQLKWGTDLANEKFQVNRIIFKYQPLSEN